MRLSDRSEAVVIVVTRVKQFSVDLHRIFCCCPYAVSAVRQETRSDLQKDRQPFRARADLREQNSAKWYPRRGQALVGTLFTQAKDHCDEAPRQGGSSGFSVHDPHSSQTETIRR